ncbi:MAG TPA: DUF4320 family protein [Caproicibacter sp.]|nr:DUF4320 family protein [Caproicibacter sp.]
MKILKSKRGEIAFESVFQIILSILVIAFAIYVFPCLTAKHQLDIYATELCRTAEISGRVGEGTTDRAKELTSNTGLSPTITWSQTGKIQQDNVVTVTCTITKDIGLWGGFGSFPVTLHGQASGKSEVYWK